MKSNEFKKGLSAAKDARITVWRDSVLALMQSAIDDAPITRPVSRRAITRRIASLPGFCVHELDAGMLEKWEALTTAFSVPYSPKKVEA